jgi:hypothetical protein
MILILQQQKQSQSLLGSSIWCFSFVHRPLPLFVLMVVHYHPDEISQKLFFFNTFGKKPYLVTKKLKKAGTLLT